MSKATLHFHHPAAGALAVTGNGPLGNWDRQTATQALSSTESVFEVDVPTGQTVELKPRLGDEWAVGSNYQVHGGEEVHLYPHFARRAGTVKVLFPSFHSHSLGNERPITVYLPPSYDENPTKRYPVIYVHDGQNLFDSIPSPMGASWRFERAMDDLIGRGEIAEAIVVAIPHMGDRRLDELGPVPDTANDAGDGAKYVSFVLDELKPVIDRTLRTRGDREHTLMIGSSMGGLISLFAAHTRPGLLGRVAALSPAAWWAGDWLANQIKERLLPPPQLDRLWVDYGDYTDDGGRGTEVLKKAYEGAGLKDGEGGYRTEVFEGKGHTESAWADRLALVLRFLLGDLRE